MVLLSFVRGELLTLAVAVALVVTMGLQGGSSGSAWAADAAAAMTNDFARTIADVRKAMAQRDLETAQKLLQAADKMAKSPTDAGEVDRLRTILGYLQQFWEAIRAATAAYGPTDVLTVNGKQTLVVEADRDLLAVRVAGRNYRFDSRTMPTALVMVLVDKHLGKDIESHAVIAAFLAVDPQGDSALAKQYWEEAARAEIDTRKLLVELERFPHDPATSKAKSREPRTPVKRTHR